MAAFLGARMSGGAIKILFLAASPADEDRLRVDQEARDIEAAITATTYRDSIQFHTQFAVRTRDLIQHLNRYRPDILHFSGHGTKKGELELEDDKGNAVPVNKERVVRLLKQFQSKIRVVVLNACYSKGQAEAITSTIDCAIGVKSAIGDRSAIEFAVGFYRALGFGNSVESAFEQAKAVLEMQHVASPNMPDLLVRDGINPSEVTLVGAVAKKLTPTESEELAWNAYVTLNSFLNSLSWYEEAEDKVEEVQRGSRSLDEIQYREGQRDRLRKENQELMHEATGVLTKINKRYRSRSVRDACQAFVQWHKDVVDHKFRAGHGSNSGGQVLLNGILDAMRKEAVSE